MYDFSANECAGIGWASYLLKIKFIWNYSWLWISVIWPWKQLKPKLWNPKFLNILNWKLWLKTEFPTVAPWWNIFLQMSLKSNVLNQILCKKWIPIIGLIGLLPITYHISVRRLIRMCLVNGIQIMENTIYYTV